MPDNQIQNSSSNKNRGLIAAVVIVIIAVAGYFLIRMNNQSTTDAQNLVSSNNSGSDTTASAVVGSDTTTATKETSGSTSTPTTAPTSGYKDGTYTATGHYVSPGGAQSLKVTLTLKNGVVTSSNVVEMASDPESENYENKFISGYKQLVVGKSIDSLNLTKVAGASLTPRGFNDAVTQIKAQAKG